MTVQDEMFLPNERQVKFELKIFETITKGNNDAIKDYNQIEAEQRSISRWSEYLENFPQNIFLIKHKNKIFFGRKLISQLKRKGNLEELHCSRINQEMVFGILSSFEQSEKKIDLFYYPLNSTEKKNFFDEMKKDKNLCLSFPFVFLTKENKERTSPAHGWSLDPLRASNLGIGEEHIRKYTHKFLANEDMNNKIVFDPACSTGQFLSEIKINYPKCITIGQDLSEQMINYARKFVDKAIVGNAIRPGVDKESCDFIFIRFLNSEVVKREDAYKIFPKLIQCLRPLGKVIIFGHTPVLLNSDYLKNYNLELLQKIAYDEESNSIFQYLVYQKKVYS